MFQMCSVMVNTFISLDLYKLKSMLKTVIVPLDFSEISYNAAEYAAEMFFHLPHVNVVFFNHADNDSEKAIAQNLLESLQKQLSSKIFQSEVLVTKEGNFIDNLSRIAQERKAHIIIMGLTGKSPLQQRFSGSNTLTMTEKNICPVLVVPPYAKFKKIRNVLIASEMKSVEESAALSTVKEVLEEYKPDLHILNVDSSHYISLTEDFKRERDKMEELLKDFNPQFYFMRLFDFHESVNMFAKDKNIDMIIIAPKHHSFFTKLFKVQHTKALIYQSEVPVLTVQD